MVSKLFTFLLVVFVAFLVVNARYADNEKAQAFDNSILEKVKEAIKNLLNLVQEKVNTATKQIQESLTKLTEKAREIVAEAAKKISESHLPLNKEIADLVVAAANQGLDRNQCVGNSVVELGNITTEAGKKLLDCSQTGIDFVQKHADLAGKEMNEFFQVGENLTIEFNACWSINLGCYAKILTQAGIEIVNVPKKIVTIIGNVIDGIPEVQKEINQCTAKEIADATEKATDIGGSVIKCLTDLLSKAN